MVKYKLKNQWGGAGMLPIHTYVATWTPDLRWIEHTANLGTTGHKAPSINPGRHTSYNDVIMCEAKALFRSQLRLCMSIVSLFQPGNQLAIRDVHARLTCRSSYMRAGQSWDSTYESDASRLSEAAIIGGLHCAHLTVSHMRGGTKVQGPRDRNQVWENHGPRIE
jgi:hypothetical protein